MTIRFNRRMGRTAFGTGFCAVLTLCNAMAAEEPGTLEEVVVTAQKREQSMQDVGISMSAFSGQQLANLGISNTDVPPV